MLAQVCPCGGLSKKYFVDTTEAGKAALPLHPVSHFAVRPVFAECALIPSVCKHACDSSALKYVAFKHPLQVFGLSQTHIMLKPTASPKH